MGLYDTRVVNLGDIKGRGYAFTQKTAFGEATRGIIFLENEEEAQELKKQDSIQFSGSCYSGNRETRCDIEVRIEDVTSTPMGTRVDFVEADYPPTLLE